MCIDEVVQILKGNVQFWKFSPVHAFELF